MSDNQVYPLDRAVEEIASALAAARGGRDAARLGMGSMLSPGDVADLRRMDTNVPAGAFWRLMARCVPPFLRNAPEQEQRWALMVKGMALMAPQHHLNGAAPGAALAKTGYASDDRPLRINKLLSAEGEAFEDLFLGACRFLSSKAEPVDWRRFARFAIHQDDTSRNDVARSFYGAN